MQHTVNNQRRKGSLIILPDGIELKLVISGFAFLFGVSLPLLPFIWIRNSAAERQGKATEGFALGRGPATAACNPLLMGKDTWMLR